jgi:hypothetical protein
MGLTTGIFLLALAPNNFTHSSSVLKIAADMLNKRLRTADIERSSSDGSTCHIAIDASMLICGTNKRLRRFVYQKIIVFFSEAILNNENVTWAIYDTRTMSYFEFLKTKQKKKKSKVCY